MKLLIVDDEELTRTGLIASIPWDSLGINKLLQAEDGMQGLSIALAERPQIVLCDVRMPKMNGIEMTERISEKLPDTVFIFMSGYSDKEYLKAAIKFKAVSYVEKPLNLAEVKDAISEAVERFNQQQEALRSKNWKHLENFSKLALQLTLPYSHNKMQIISLLDDLSLTELSNHHFTCFLIRILEHDAGDEEYFKNLSQKLNQFLSSYKMSSFSVDKRQSYHIIHIHGKNSPSLLTLNEISAFFHKNLSDHNTVSICRGQSVCGVAHAYQSYESAVILMQNSFFFTSEEVLSPEYLEQLKQNAAAAPNSFLPESLPDFSEALLEKNSEKCMSILDSLYHYFFHNTELMADQAKELYYRLFSALIDARKHMHLSDVYFFQSESETLFSYLDTFFNYIALHTALEQSVESYFSELGNQIEENSTVFLIKDYIEKHYMNEMLSVKDISEHVYLSASYVCTLFKSETGITLNQYITFYRMERAKKLLQDPRNKITDISASVGYNDGNYFGKSFKKIIGLSPSEYREKMMK